MSLQGGRSTTGLPCFALNPGLSRSASRDTLVANLEARRVVGRPAAGTDQASVLLFRARRAAPTSDWLRCAPCSAGIARLLPPATPDLHCAASANAGGVAATNELTASAEAPYPRKGGKPTAVGAIAQPGAKQEARKESRTANKRASSRRLSSCLGVAAITAGMDWCHDVVPSIDVI
jgi:hypothetical protein